MSRRPSRPSDLRRRPCAYCQGSPYHDSVVDLVIPAARGGRAHHLNQVPCCAGCAAEKGNQTAIEWAIVLATLGDYSRAQRALGAQARADRWLRANRATASGSIHS